HRSPELPQRRELSTPLNLLEPQHDGVGDPQPRGLFGPFEQLRRQVDRHLLDRLAHTLSMIVWSEPGNCMVAAHQMGASVSWPAAGLAPADGLEVARHLGLVV